MGNLKSRDYISFITGALAFSNYVHIIEAINKCKKFRNCVCDYLTDEYIFSRYLQHTIKSVPALNVVTEQISRIRETLILSTNAIEVPGKCCGCVVKVQLKCPRIVIEVQIANSHSHKTSPANSPTIHSKLVPNRAF